MGFDERPGFGDPLSRVDGAADDGRVIPRERPDLIDVENFRGLTAGCHLVRDCLRDFPRASVFRGVCNKYVHL